MNRRWPASDTIPWSTGAKSRNTCTVLLQNTRVSHVTDPPDPVCQNTPRDSEKENSETREIPEDDEKERKKKKK